MLFRLARGSGLSGLRGMARQASLPGLTRQSIATRRLLRSGWMRGSSPRMTSCSIVRPLLRPQVPPARHPARRQDPLRGRSLEPRSALHPAAPARTDAARLPPKGSTRGGSRASRARMARADQAIERAVDEAAARLLASPRAGLVGISAATMRICPPKSRCACSAGRSRRSATRGRSSSASSRRCTPLSQPRWRKSRRAARFRRTLAGALVTFAGEITVERAPARRSGASASTKRRKARVHQGPVEGRIFGQFPWQKGPPNLSCLTVGRGRPRFTQCRQQTAGWNAARARSFKDLG